VRRWLTTLIAVFSIMGGLPAEADIVELVFSPDSLIQTGENHNYTYPSTHAITINPELSLPVKTIYLNSSAIHSDIVVTVERVNQLQIGTVLKNRLKFSDLITALENRQKQSLLHDITDFESPIYDRQMISKDGHSLLAVSILPVTIDKENNLILNTRIAISIDAPLFETYNGSNLHSVLDNYTVHHTNRFSNKVGLSDSIGIIPRYVIITSSELAPAFEELVDFKNATGIPTIIMLVDSIYANYPGLDEIEQIRNYLIDFYNNGGEYVLLGGNDAVIPVRYLYYYNTSTPPSNPYNLMPSDLYYADLDGDWDLDGDGIWGEPTHDAPDIVPELMVGRLPVMTISAIENYVSKLILYQTDPGHGDFDYLERSLIFSSDQMRDYPASGQHGYIANEYPDNIYIDTSQTIEMPDGFDPSPTNPNGAADIVKISEGFGLIHILAHGRRDGFRVKASGYDSYPASLILSTPQTNGHGSLVDLEANGKVSLYYSLSCQVGGYDLDSTNGLPDDWSFVETAIAAENAGAIGMVAYSRWGWVYSSYYLEASFTKHLYGDADGNPVKAMYYSWLDYPYYRDLIYGQNFFGDPTVGFYRTKPLKLELDISATKGEASFFASINNRPIPDVTVVIAMDGVILEEGLTDENGRFESTIDLIYGNDYYLTAYKDSCTIFRTVYSPSITLDNEDDETERQLPTEYGLEQNFPNPFNSATTIRYRLPKTDDVTLEFFNILGQLVNTHDFGKQPAGIYSYTWNGSDYNNQPLSSGIYFYRLRTGEFVETKKMVLIK